MSPFWVDSLRHIRDEAEYLIGQTEGLSRLEFLEDGTLKRAFVRSLEIIGEATKKLPVEVRDEYASVDWRAMAGMRDRLIHAYFGVDYDIVWDVVANKVPQLRFVVQQIILDAEKEPFETDQVISSEEPE